MGYCLKVLRGLNFNLRICNLYRAHYATPYNSAVLFLQYALEAILNTGSTWSTQTQSFIFLQYFIMEDKYLRTLNDILSNITVTANTGCHVTNKSPYKGEAYPKIRFTHNHKPFRVNIHTFVYKVTNGIPPYTPNPGLECSHLCHNPLCVNLEHIVLEDKHINRMRQSCNRRRVCYGHLRHKKCISCECILHKNYTHVTT